MDSGVGHQIGLEFSDIHIQGTVESQRGSQRRDDLGHQSVEVGVGGSLDIQLSSADVVDGFVVQHDGHIGVFQQGVSGQDGVVRFHNGSGYLGRGVHSEAQLGFLAVVHGKSFQEEGSESGSSSSTDGVEDHEALETSTVVSQLPDSVEAQVNDFLTNGVVTSGEVVGSIFLSADQLFGVEQLSVGAGPDFIDDGGFQIQEDTSGDVFTSTSFAEEGVEGIITTADSLIGGHLAIGLDTVFQAEQFPAGVTNLDTGLTNMNTDYFSHF